MSANSALRPVRERGWRMGLANMLAKESRAWWRTRRWWIQCLLWLVLLNGTLWLNIRGHSTDSGLVFLMMAGLAVPIGAISLGQDSILGERHSGTAAWVLSKPVRRPAFVLAKLVALGLGLLVTGVVLPGVIAFFQLRANGLSQLLSAPHWAEAMGLIYLSILFYLTLALMLATLFHGRGPVLAITLMILLAGLMPWSYGLVDKHAPWLVAVLPWDLLMSGSGTPLGVGLPLTALVALGQPLPTVTPIIGTAVWCVLFVVAAIWRFGREEF